MVATAYPPRVARAVRKITVAWILWAAPTESRGADPDEDGQRRSVGAVIGSPQKLGFVFEVPLRARLALQLHGGTNFDDHAAGGRLLAREHAPQGFYVYAGGGAVTSGGGIDRVHPYLSVGAGVQAGTPRLRFFGEAGPVMYPDAPGRNGVGLAFGVLGSMVEESPASRPAGGERGEWADTHLSAVVGFPYLIGIGIEGRASSEASVALTVGSVLLATTVTVRGIVGAQDGTGFYATGGLGVGFFHPGTPGGWAGTFAMGGLGGRWSDRGVGVFAEVGGVVVPSIQGESGVLPMFATGLLFQP